MSKKLTEWFESTETPPTKVGVYELYITNPSGTGGCFSHWNGEKFGYRVFTHRDDSRQNTIDRAFECRVEFTELPKFARWRGLAVKP
jgi:hypothetical protein